MLPNANSRAFSAAILVFQDNEMPAMLASDAVLLELTSFLLQMLSFVPVNFQHRCWSRQWKRSI